MDSASPQRRRHHYPLSILLLVAALVAACGDDAVPDQQQIQPFAAATVVRPPDPTANPTAVPIPEPSAADLAAGNRTLEPPPTPSFTPTPPPTPTHTPTATPEPDRDCSDFDAWQAAQDFFLSAGGPGSDPHRLDGDGDGVACEDLPGAPEPTATPSATPTATQSPASPEPPGLPSGCVSGGDLDDPALVSTCNAAAMARLETYSFEMTLSLAPSLALVPAPPDAEIGAMTIAGAVRLPESMQFTLSVGGGGFRLEIPSIQIGDDIYVKDPMLGAWYKDSVGATAGEGLLAIEQLKQVDQPLSGTATLSGVVTLDDGTRAYELLAEVSDVPVGSLDLEQLGERSGSASVLVGVEDFLSREINVEIENQDGRLETLVAITFSGFNDPVTIEPPEEYEDISTLQDPAVLPTPQGGTEGDPSRSPPASSVTLYGFDKDWDDNILAHLSDAVHVYGAAELQVLDSDGRGWSLPLLHGSGTSSLTFDAHAEGKSAITLGKTTVVGFVFLETDAEIVDDNGQPVDLVFEPWTYPADITDPSTDAPWLEGITQNSAGSIVLTFSEGVNVTDKSGLKVGLAPSGELDLDSDFTDGSAEMKFCQPNGATALAAGAIVAGFIIPDGTTITDADGNKAQFAFQPYTATAAMEVASATGSCG